MYEPTGKLKPFIDAVRREPTRIWTPAEIAILMGVQQSRVGSWMDYAMNVKAVFRGKRNNQVVYAGQPFPPEAAYPRVAERNAAPPPAPTTPPGDLHVPKFGEPWTAPKMTAPRPGSDVPAPARAPGPPPAPVAEKAQLCAGCHRPICIEKGCVAGKVESLIVPSDRPPESAPPAQAPIAAPAVLDPVEQERAELEEEPQVVEEDEEEQQAFDCFLSLVTGQMVLMGVEVDEAGRVTLQPEQVNLIRERAAWGRPA